MEGETHNMNYGPDSRSQAPSGLRPPRPHHRDSPFDKDTREETDNGKAAPQPYSPIQDDNTTVGNNSLLKTPENLGDRPRATKFRTLRHTGPSIDSRTFKYRNTSSDQASISSRSGYELDASISSHDSSAGGDGLFDSRTGSLFHAALLAKPETPKHTSPGAVQLQTPRHLTKFGGSGGSPTHKSPNTTKDQRESPLRRWLGKLRNSPRPASSDSDQEPLLYSDPALAPTSPLLDPSHSSPRCGRFIGCSRG